jgi:predicted ATPase
VSISGKQCLVETHSEYLIHRLRRRIAESPGSELTNLSKLYFVERENGITACRPIDISRYGSIHEWPVDFFDQTQEETESIVMAATSKRALEKKGTR